MKIRLWAFLLVLLVPFLAIAEAVVGQPIPVPGTVEEAVVLIPQFLTAISSGNHNIMGGMVLMIVMIGVRQYVIPKWKISSEMLPWITAIIGVVITIANALTNGLTIDQAVQSGIEIALTAGGAWGLLGKAIANHLLKGNLAQAPKVL